jgi:hypothetical protein
LKSDARLRGGGLQTKKTSARRRRAGDKVEESPPHRITEGNPPSISALLKPFIFKGFFCYGAKYGAFGAKINK